jgi:multiple sugar transport system ATP-binding protein
MATRVAIMSTGHLQQVGTPQEVYDAPANLFVAQFIGTPPMNTMPGTFTSEGGGPAIEVGDSRFPVPAGLTTRLEEGRPVVVGARPEHLEVTAGGPIAHKVRAVEWLGHECLVMGSVGENPVIVRQVGMSPQEAGSTIELSVDPADVHLFDPDTTDRLP